MTWLLWRGIAGLLALTAPSHPPQRHGPARLPRHRASVKLFATTPGITMAQGPGAIRKAWYQWKMQRFPWRKKWLVGACVSQSLLLHARML